MPGKDTATSPPTANDLIVITGATGHLGASLCRLMLQLGFRLRGLHRRPESAAALSGLDMELRRGDITDENFMREALTGATAVIHLAAKISISGDKDGSVARTNIQGPRLISELCLELGVRKLLHISSIHMFDLYSVAGEISEDAPLTPDDGFAYDVSKRKGYQQVRAATEKGLDASVLCPVGLLGPYDYEPSLMGKFFVNYYKGRLPSLIKGGFFWADTRDTAAAIVAALTQSKRGEVYLLGGRYAKVAEVAHLSDEATGKKQRLPVLPYSLALLGLPFLSAYSKLTGSPPLYTYESIKVLHKSPSGINYSKAQKELGYNLRPLRDTIADTYAWHFSAGALQGEDKAAAGAPPQNTRK